MTEKVLLTGRQSWKTARREQRPVTEEGGEEEINSAKKVQEGGLSCRYFNEERMSRRKKEKWLKGEIQLTEEKGGSDVVNRAACAGSFYFSREESARA